MKYKPIQYFNKEYIEHCRGLTPDQILEFIDDFQKLMTQKPEKCQLISIKIEPSLLKSFKFKSKLAGIPYQSQLKKLMKEWIESG